VHRERIAVDILPSIRRTRALTSIKEQHWQAVAAQRAKRRTCQHVRCPVHVPHDAEQPAEPSHQAAHKPVRGEH
jgi:hypothetical protein